MKVTLKNIGVIRDSSASLDGLTVICGDNATGKSTLGKACYALFAGAREKEPSTSIRDILMDEFGARPIRSDAPDKLHAALKVACDGHDIITAEIDGDEFKLSTVKPIFDSVALIDNPCVIGNAFNRIIFNGIGGEPRDAVYSNYHDYNLLCAILAASKKEKRGGDIISEKLDALVSGDYTVDDSGAELIVKGADRFRASNLSTGMKLFTIIKTLYNGGFISKNSLLIFDEPESHLHPSWQNKFAELAALLVKSGVRITVATHSANLLLALEAYALENGVYDLTRFYLTESEGDGYYHYIDVTGHTDEIFDRFLEHFAEVKALRDNLTEYADDGEI